MKNGLHYNPYLCKRAKKLTFLLFSALCLAGVFPTYSYAQITQELEKPIALDLKEATLRQSLDAIEGQSKVLFNVQSSLLAKYPVRINLKDDRITIKAALSKIFENTNLRHRVLEGALLIEEKPVTQSPSRPNAQAGQGTGAVKGRIVEFETSQPLPGASVRIAGTQIGGQSNESGYYSLTGIPAGNHTLEVSFIGYQTENVQVNVRANGEATYDVRLQGSTALDEITITAIAKTRAPVPHATERQVLEEIKMAQSVVSGISSQQISKTADRNAAEVVQKIAGVTVRDDKFIVIRGMNERYNLTYLNNNIAPSTELHSRAFALDLIPTRIIDRIMVYKSPAPDLLGDMTGGAVKIFTKDAKTVKHFDVEFRTGIRQNTTFNKDFLTYQGGKFDFLGFDDGGRKLPNSVPGFGDFTKANISQKTYAETFSNILEYRKKSALPPLQLTANYYNTFRVGGKFLSILTSLSYNNEPTHLDVDRQQKDAVGYRIGTESQSTDAAQISLLQNFTYSVKDSSHIYFKNFLLQQGQQVTMLRNAAIGQMISANEEDGWQDISGLLNGTKRFRNILLSWSQRFLYSGNIGGDFKIGKRGKQQLDWNTGYTYSRLTIPDQRMIRLQNNVYHSNFLDLQLDADNYEQNWIPVFRDESLENNDPTNVMLGHISRLWTRNTEAVYNGSVDYTFKMKPWITLKTGTYQQWKERVVFRRVYTVNEGDLLSNGFPVAGSQIGTAVPGTDYNLVFWRQQDLGKLWSSTYLRDDGTALKVFDRTTGSDAYTATEQNNAGYVAASLLPFDGKLDIYGGLRVEYNRQKVAGARGSSETDWNTPVLTDLKSTELLPSINIGYRPNNDWVVRAAYGRTVNRPEFRELSPYAELDYINNQQITGNSSLVFATVNNYDLRFEWYPNANAKGETISIGGFYKDITKPIERTSYRGLGNVATYKVDGLTQISYQNADQAKVYGVEFDIRKNLDFIPGSFFRNLSVIANGSYIHSEVATDTTGMSIYDRGNVVAKRQLQGQAPYQFNAGLYYDNAGSGTRVALVYNEVGERIYAAAIGDTTLSASNFGVQGSLIELPRRQLDFSLTQRVVKSLQAKLSVQNLLNQSVDMVEDTNYTFKYEKAQFVAPTDDSSTGTYDGDTPYSSYRPGRFFLLTLTYGF